MARLNTVRRRLVTHRDVKSLADFMRHIEGLEWLGIVDPGETITTPSDVWRLITPIAAEPSERLSDTATAEQSVRWLQGLIAQVDLGEQFYLAIGGYALPWSKVRADPTRNWIAPLWERLEHEEIVLLNHHERAAVGITEEEHGTYGFVVVLPEPG
jgi:hypothetical protein